MLDVDTGHRRTGRPRSLRDQPRASRNVVSISTSRSRTHWSAQVYAARALSRSRLVSAVGMCVLTCRAAQSNLRPIT
jgi:hypothetical protein